MKNQDNKKVVVAVSGGVDSSVALALLKRANFNCLACYMRLSGRDKQAEKRAREVARILSVPFKVVDLQKQFKKKAIDYFVKEYSQGATPNPCVVCNKEIKFGLLSNWARERGFDCLSTGHYAQVKQDRQGKYKLFKAKDKNKDQSYFLWRLTQKQLSHVLLPIGAMENKQEVRNLAKKFDLPTYRAEESTDVCFLKNKDIYSFLAKQIKASKKGNIVDMKGRKIGEHNGLYRYTIGQRKGIMLSGGPYFVIRKDIKNNNLIVSKNEKDLLSKELVADKVNWLNGEEPKLPLKVESKIRYKTQPASCVIKKRIAKGKYQVVFSKPQRAITSGQSVVFYQGQELLGGGIIQ